MADRLPRRRRFAVPALLVVASVLAVLAMFSVWANRQALNAQNWSDTSAALLENSTIRTQVSGYLVDELYNNVDVAGEVGAALPPRLQPLAGPAANGLRQAAERTTDGLLGRPRIQAAWKAANEVTAQQFINIAEGKSGAITSSGNAVVLDLRPLVLQVVQRLGLPGKLAGQIPPGAGKIKILDSQQVSTVQDGASALRGLALILPPLSLALFGLAVFVARGRRRSTLLWAGVDLFAAGAVVLVARNQLGDYVVGALVPSEAVQPAAHEAWSIGTSMLRDVAQATMIAAVPVLLAALLAGPTRPAVAIRRALAPPLRDRPGASYAVLAGLVLLIIAWGPIPATRKVIPVLVMIALVVLGFEALRRQTAQEFPHAGRAGLPFMPSSRDARGLERLERLATLHDRGALSDEEFATQKAAVLNGG